MVEYPTNTLDTVDATRNVTAFFDSQDAADRARTDLIAAGLSPDTISIIGGVRGGDPAAEEDGGFWHALKEFFMPDEDRYTFAEGLRRGGFALSVQTSEAHYDRAVDILDADGAVDIDEREKSWRDDGWTAGPQRNAVAESVAYAAADARTAGFGGSLAGDDGYAPAAPLTRGGALESEALADTTRVGTGPGTPGELNPDFRERIGSGTASMTPATPSGPQDSTLHNNAANVDRTGSSYAPAAAAEAAALGSPTRSATETPSARSTMGSMTSHGTESRVSNEAPATAYRRDDALQRARVRGFIRDPLEDDRNGTL